jgi:hypothetical protein
MEEESISTMQTVRQMVGGQGHLRQEGAPPAFCAAVFIISSQVHNNLLWRWKHKSFAIAHHFRTFVPGTKLTNPILSEKEKSWIP